MIGYTPLPCYSLLFAPNTNPQVLQIINQIAKQNNPPLSLNSDILGFYNETLLDDYIIANPNVTLGAVAFITFGTSIPAYIVKRNVTGNDFAGAIIASVEKAMMALNLNCSFQPTISVYSFPKADTIRPEENIQTKTMKDQGPLWFFVAPMFNFILFCNLLVSEKEKKLRQGLAVMGCRDSAFWMSWLATLFAVCFLNSAVTVQIPNK